MKENYDYNNPYNAKRAIIYYKIRMLYETLDSLIRKFKLNKADVKLTILSEFYGYEERSIFKKKYAKHNPVQHFSLNTIEIFYKYLKAIINVPFYDQKEINRLKNEFYVTPCELKYFLKLERPENIDDLMTNLIIKNAMAFRKTAKLINALPEYNENDALIPPHITAEEISLCYDSQSQEKKNALDILTNKKVIVSHTQFDKVKCDENSLLNNEKIIKFNKNKEIDENSGMGI